MNVSDSQQKESSWTWADIISTYRFWGLAIFFVLAVALVDFLANNFVVRMLTTTKGYSANNMTIFYLVLAVSQIYGFFLAWLGVRTREKWVLVGLVILQFVGMFLILHNDREFTWTHRFIGAGIRGLTMGAFYLLIPTIIAGARGTSQTFFIGFAVLTLVNTASYQAKVYFTTIAQTTVSPLVLIAALSLLGIIFLLPAKTSFFKLAPPPRGYPLPPEVRNPLTTALKCLIPIYNIYWLYNWIYRVHGETAWLAPARNLLSPRAAVIGAIFGPMVLFISEIQLVDALNQRAAEQGKPPVASTWWVGFWAFFLNIVAIGLIQSALNRTAEMAAQSAPPVIPAEPAMPAEPGI